MSDNFKSVEGKYITFVLGRDEYGVSVNKVHEILGPEGIQEAEMDHPCLKGTLKLRNQVVPVIDLRCRFGLDSISTKNGAVLVTAFGKDGQSTALLVDSICQVLHIDSRVLRKQALSPDDPRAEFIICTAHIEGRVLSLLDFDKGKDLVPVSAVTK